MDQLRTAGLGLAAISYDRPEVLAAFSRQRGITFPLLSDVGSATIRAFGILNTVADEVLGAGANDAVVQADVRRFVAVNGSLSVAELTRGTPFPGTFVVDREGRVTARHFEEFYRQRRTASSLLLELGAGRPPVAATKVATDHLEITTYPSDAVVSPGSRFSLVVEVAPKPGMHLYAPGATGYRVVSLRLEEQPFVRLLPMTYPASEIYHFVPLDERVPVYMKPFTLARGITIEVTAEAERALHSRWSLTLSGAFEYQA